MKLCKDCRHYKIIETKGRYVNDYEPIIKDGKEYNVVLQTAWIREVCMKTAVYTEEEPNPVSGYIHRSVKIDPCSQERKWDIVGCGKEGRLFEPIPPQDKKPFWRFW